MAIFTVEKLTDSELEYPREFRVDPRWYAAQYPGARLAIENGLFEDAAEHYQREGARRGNQPSPFFAPRFVHLQLRQKGKSDQDDLREGLVENAAEHSMSPHWLFDEAFFLRQHPKVRDALDKRNLICSFLYFIRFCDQTEDRPGALFDPNFYLAQEGAIQSETPFSSYVTEQVASEIRTSHLFDPDFYRAANPDIGAQIGPGRPFNSSLHHFAEVGIFEGRACLPDFDRDYYLRAYPDIRDASENKRVSPVEHFLRHGMFEMRNPNKYFDTRFYLDRHPSVVDDIKQFGFAGPFEHFLAIGSKRGYRASPPLISMSIDEEAGKALFEKRAKVAAQNLFLGGRKLKFPRHDEVDISCIVPVFNKVDMTAHFLTQLRAVAADAEGPRIEVIVVDNGSTDRTVSIADWTENLVLVREDAPLGYTKACNLGARAARGKYLLFLNNDMEIAPDAITNAYETAQAEGVGVVGARIILTNGVLQEAGSIAWRDGSTLGYGRGESPTDGRFLFARDVDYCSGCFLMVERGLFEKLDGFSEDFSPGYYEETDLCARVWDEGRRVVYEPGAVVTHYEYASYSSGRPPTVSRAIMARHRERFVKRNPDFLARQAMPGPRNVAEASTRSGRPPHVLIFDDLLPDPRFGSGFVRSSTLVETFRRLGWRVTVWAADERSTRIEETLEEIGVSAIVATRAQRRLATFLATNGGDIDLMWVCRTHNFGTVRAETASWRQQNPDARMIGDTEAIAATREIEVEAVVGRSVDRDVEAMIRNELSAGEAMDALITVNALDHDAASAAVAKPVHVLGHTLPAAPTPRDFAARAGFLFCGAIHERESPNLDSLLWYAREVHPRIREAIPDATLAVVGYWRASVPPPKLLTETEGIELIGPVEDLRPHFDAARVFVAPTRFAGGVPHKVHQAMSLGLPSVVTPLLRAQLVEPGLSLADVPVLAPGELDGAAFAHCCVELYNDEEAWTALREDGLAFMRAHCSEERFAEALTDILEDLGFGKDRPNIA
ncbi:MAG: glycosyltransferase [Sphingomonadaceae bacterium]|nr:glycosyltransferase [Sphingomonadaceae bacterium]